MSESNNHIFSSSSVALLKQESLGIQRCCVNGTSKEVHYVVKNQPFLLHLHSNNLNLANSLAEASLYYDSDESKQVEIPTGAPVSCRVIPSKGSFVAEIEVELTVKVLSSHHGNSSFRVKVWLHTQSGEQVEVLSHSILSVSKPKQVEKCLSKSSQPTKIRTKRPASNSKVLAPLTANDSASAFGHPTPAVQMPTIDSNDTTVLLKGIMQYLAVIDAKVDHQHQQLNALFHMLNPQLEERPSKFQKANGPAINLFNSKDNASDIDPSSSLFDDLLSDDMNIPTSDV